MVAFIHLDPLHWYPWVWGLLLVAAGIVYVRREWERIITRGVWWGLLGVLLTLFAV